MANLLNSLESSEEDEVPTIRRNLLDMRVDDIHRKLSTVFKMITSGSPCNSISTISACISGNCVTDGSTNIGVCAVADKPCPNYCNDQGTCRYKHIEGGDLTACPKSDLFCYSFCKCNDGYFGLDCGVNGAAELTTTKELRDDVCFNLETVKSIQNENDDVLLSRAILIADTIKDHTQINLDAFTTCVNLLIQTIEDYPDISGSSTHFFSF